MNEQLEHLCCACVIKSSKDYALIEQERDFLKEELSNLNEKIIAEKMRYSDMIRALSKNSPERQQDVPASPERQAEKTIENMKYQLGKIHIELEEYKERLTTTEIKMERQELDFKIEKQRLSDEIIETKLKLKQKKADIQMLHVQIERERQDQAFEFRENMFREGERLFQEKQHELDQAAKRHESLIQMLIESHKNEMHLLRERHISNKRQQNDYSVQSGEITLSMDKSLSEVQEDENQISIMEGTLQQLENDNSTLQRNLIIASQELQKKANEEQRMRRSVIELKKTAAESQEQLKAHICQERKCSDQEKNGHHHSCEIKLHRKQIELNVVLNKLKKLEDFERHQYKILVMKRQQIEQEKTQMKEHHNKQMRCAIRSNISQKSFEKNLAGKALAIEKKNKCLQGKVIQLADEVNTLRKSSHGSPGESLVGFQSPFLSQRDLQNSSLLSRSFRQMSPSTIKLGRMRLSEVPGINFSQSPRLSNVHNKIFVGQNQSSGEVELHDTIPFIEQKGPAMNILDMEDPVNKIPRLQGMKSMLSSQEALDDESFSVPQIKSLVNSAYTKKQESMYTRNLQVAPPGSNSSVRKQLQKQKSPKAKPFAEAKAKVDTGLKVSKIQSQPNDENIMDEFKSLVLDSQKAARMTYESPKTTSSKKLIKLTNHSTVLKDKEPKRFSKVENTILQVKQQNSFSPRYASPGKKLLQRRNSPKSTITSKPMNGYKNLHDRLKKADKEQKSKPVQLNSALKKESKIPTEETETSLHQEKEKNQALEAQIQMLQQTFSIHQQQTSDSELKMKTAIEAMQARLIYKHSSSANNSSLNSRVVEEPLISSEQSHFMQYGNENENEF